MQKKCNLNFFLEKKSCGCVELWFLRYCMVLIYSLIVFFCSIVCFSILFTYCSCCRDAKSSRNALKKNKIGLEKFFFCCEVGDGRFWGWIRIVFGKESRGDWVVFGRDQLRSLYNTCTIVVRLLSAFQLYIYCTNSGQQADNNWSWPREGLEMSWLCCFDCVPA